MQKKNLYTKFGTYVHKMVQEAHKWYKILECYYEYPLSSFTVRDLAKKTKLPVTTVQRHLTEMKKAKVLNKNGELWDCPSRRFRKAFSMIDKVIDSGLVEFLEIEFSSSVIVIFGSVRKGEYDKNSDIDIFIESSLSPIRDDPTGPEKDIDLKKFEKKIGHKIQLFINKSISALPIHLRNNVLNGIKLSGYIDLK